MTSAKSAKRYRLVCGRHVSIMALFPWKGDGKHVRHANACKMRGRAHSYTVVTRIRNRRGSSNKADWTTPNRVKRPVSATSCATGNRTSARLMTIKCALTHLIWGVQPCKEASGAGGNDGRAKRTAHSHVLLRSNRFAREGQNNAQRRPSLISLFLLRPSGGKSPSLLLLPIPF